MTNFTLTGRQEERAILQQALDTPEAEMVAVYGRRRVGKTFLIKQVYQERIVFEITGIQKAPYAEQIQNFVQQLNKVAENTLPVQTPKNWLEAFHLLTVLLEKKLSDQKGVVFFDELPWESRPSYPLRPMKTIPFRGPTFRPGSREGR